MSDYQKLLTAVRNAGVTVNSTLEGGVLVVLPAPEGMMRADRHQALLELLEKMDLRVNWTALYGWSVTTPSYKERVEHRKRADEAVAELARLGYLYNHREQKWLEPPAVSAGDYAHAVPRHEYKALCAAQNRLLADGFRWENGRWNEPVNFSGPRNTLHDEERAQDAVKALVGAGWTYRYQQREWNAPAPQATPLVEFFRSKAGYEHFGAEGDRLCWSTEETAVYFLRQWMGVKGALFVKNIKYVETDGNYTIVMPEAFRTHVVCNIDAGDFADGAKAAFECVKDVCDHMRHDAREWEYRVKLDPDTGYIVGWEPVTIKTDRFKVHQPYAEVMAKAVYPKAEPVNLGASSALEPYTLGISIDGNEVTADIKGVLYSAHYSPTLHHLLEAVIAAMIAVPAKA